LIKVNLKRQIQKWPNVCSTFSVAFHGATMKLSEAAITLWLHLTKRKKHKSSNPNPQGSFQSIDPKKQFKWKNKTKRRVKLCTHARFAWFTITVTLILM
jgi:hypothetical protein